MIDAEALEKLKSMDIKAALDVATPEQRNEVMALIAKAKKASAGREQPIPALEPVSEPSFLSRGLSHGKSILRGAGSLIRQGAESIGVAKRDFDPEQYSLDQYRNKMIGLAHDETALPGNRMEAARQDLLAKEKMANDLMVREAEYTQKDIDQARGFYDQALDRARAEQMSINSTNEKIVAYKKLLQETTDPATRTTLEANIGTLEAEANRSKARLNQYSSLGNKALEYLKGAEGKGYKPSSFIYADEPAAPAASAAPAAVAAPADDLTSKSNQYISSLPAGSNPSEVAIKDGYRKMFGTDPTAGQVAEISKAFSHAQGTEHNKASHAADMEGKNLSNAEKQRARAAEIAEAREEIEILNNEIALLEKAAGSTITLQMAGELAPYLSNSDEVKGLTLPGAVGAVFNYISPGIAEEQALKNPKVQAAYKSAARKEANARKKTVAGLKAKLPKEKKTEAKKTFSLEGW